MYVCMYVCGRPRDCFFFWAVRWLIASRVVEGGDSPRTLPGGFCGAQPLFSVETRGHDDDGTNQADRRGRPRRPQLLLFGGHGGPVRLLQVFQRRRDGVRRLPVRRQLTEPGHHAAVDPAGSQKEERHQRDGQRLSPGDAEEELCQRALRAARAEGGRRLEPQDRGRVRGPRGQPRAGGRGQSGAGEQGSAGDHDPADAPGPRGRQEAGASRRGRRQRSAVADADERQRHPRREGRRQAGHGEEVGVHRPKFTLRRRRVRRRAGDVGGHLQRGPHVFPHLEGERLQRDGRRGGGRRPEQVRRRLDQPRAVLDRGRRQHHQEHLPDPPRRHAEEEHPPPEAGTATPLLGQHREAATARRARHRGGQGGRRRRRDRPVRRQQLRMRVRPPPEGEPPEADRQRLRSDAGEELLLQQEVSKVREPRDAAAAPPEEQQRHLYRRATVLLATGGDDEDDPRRASHQPQEQRHRRPLLLRTSAASAGDSGNFPDSRHLCHVNIAARYIVLDNLNTQTVISL